MCLCVCVNVSVSVSLPVCLSLVCVVGVIFVYADMYMGFMGILFMLSWMFQHDYLDTCFECLICRCFVFLYLHLFSALEHVSHGKAL